MQTFSQLKHLVISERFDVIRKTQYGNFLNIFDQHFLWQTASFYLTTVDDPETFILWWENMQFFRMKVILNYLPDVPNVDYVELT